MPTTHLLPLLGSEGALPLPPEACHPLADQPLLLRRPPHLPKRYVMTCAECRVKAHSFVPPFPRYRARARSDECRDDML